MKISYASPELEYEAERDKAADSWVFTHRAEYDEMLKEAFPAGMPRRVGEWNRRRAVLDGMVYVKCGFPGFTEWRAAA